jgi:hypothetical protein
VNSSSQLGLDLLHDAAKGSLVVHGEVGQHLRSISMKLLQPLANCCRSGPIHGSGVDTGNPQLAEHALRAAVTVGILPSLHYRLFGDTEDVTAATTETLSRARTFLHGRGRYTTFDEACMSPCSSVIKGQRWAAFVRSAHVGLMHIHCTTQMALVLVVFLVKMCLEGLTALDGATGTNAETFSRCSWSSFGRDAPFVLP